MDTSLGIQVTDLEFGNGKSTPRTIWVGPTTCDSERDRRTETQSKIWQELSRNPHMAFAHPIIGSAFDLLRESLSCYQNGAFMASTLMCRTVTETGLYLAVSRKPSQKKRPMEIWLDLRNTRDWGQIRTKAVNLDILSEDEMKLLHDIRERGHFVAHYGERFDRQVRSAVSLREGLRTWVDEKEAEGTLHDTVFIVSRIIDWIGRL